MKTKDRPKTYSAIIEDPATEESFGRRIRIDLDAEQTAEVQAFADRCGVTLDAFVRCYLTGHGCGHVRTWDYSQPPKVRLERVVLNPRTAQKHLKRLERAAGLFSQTVEQFVAEAINNNIVGAEDAMLVNPKTGELLGFDELDYLRENVEYTAPTLRQQRGEEPLRGWQGRWPAPAPAASSEPETEPETKVEPGGLALTVEIPSSGWQHGGTCHVVLTAKDANRIKELADESGLTVEAFVAGYRTVAGDQGLCGLPNQAKHREEALPKGYLPDLSFVNEDTIRRLQRVAEFRGKTFVEVITEELESTIELYEVDMLFHPETGEVIADTTETALEAIRDFPVVGQDEKGGAQ